MKNIRKLNTIRERTINNTTQQERGVGVDSLKVAPRERSNTKGI